MKKRIITLSLGFVFLIAGFGVSYDFDYGSFQVKSNEVKAEKDPTPDSPEGLFENKDGSGALDCRCIHNKWYCMNCE